MTEVTSAVEELGDARTPSEVIARGVGDVWNRITELRTEYDSIRDAQRSAMSAHGFEAASAKSRYLWDDALADDTQISNLDEVFPGWKEETVRIRKLRADGDERPQPWPKDPTEQLVWLATSGAKVWVPTAGQLATLRRPAAVSNHRPDRPVEIWSSQDMTSH